jgi:pantetheine-phosphate adenylyltransferase
MRVIAGSAGGRRLAAPRGRGTRPTSDRVREALYSSLSPHVRGARVLDLYAGSGALGIEALSRGAECAVMVEQDPRAIAVISENLRATGLARSATVLHTTAERFTAGPDGGPFDIVLLDPPYTVSLPALWELLGRLGAAGAIAQGARVVVERDRRDPDLDRPPPEFLASDRRRSYGDTVLLYFEFDQGTERIMTVTAVCPGSFDPITNGHLDIIERAAQRFDRVVVACTRNLGKTPLFDIDERVGLVRAVTQHFGNVEVAAFEGLLVDFCHEREVGVIVKGLRAVSDFEYELQMAQMNMRIGEVETLFMTTSPVYSFLSSSLVKEVARFGGDVTDFVPPPVAAELGQRLG